MILGSAELSQRLDNELERHFRLSEYGSAATRQLLEGSRHRTVKREPNVRGNSSHSNDLEAATVQGGCRQVIYISKGTNLFLSINIKR